MTSKVKIILSLLPVVAASVVLFMVFSCERDVFSGRYRLADKSATPEEKAVVLIVGKNEQGWDAYFEGVEGGQDHHLLMKESMAPNMPKAWRCLTIESEAFSLCAVPPGTEFGYAGRYYKIKSGYFSLTQSVDEMEKID